MIKAVELNSHHCNQSQSWESVHQLGGQNWFDDNTVTRNLSCLYAWKWGSWVVRQGVFFFRPRAKQICPGIRLDWKEEELWKGNNRFGPSLVCGINVCSVQLQDMQENVRQSNLQLVFCRLFKEETSEFYSRACFVIFELNLLPKLKKVKDFKTRQDITK